MPCHPPHPAFPPLPTQAEIDAADERAAVDRSNVLALIALAAAAIPAAVGVAALAWQLAAFAHRLVGAGL